MNDPWRGSGMCKGPNTKNCQDPRQKEGSALFVGMVREGSRCSMESSGRSLGTVSQMEKQRAQRKEEPCLDSRQS